MVVEVLGAGPSFFSPSLGGPNRLVVAAGAASFFSSGFGASLFVVVTPNSPPPPVPPVPPNEKPTVVGGTGVDVPDVSGFLTPNKPAPSAGVVVEVDVEVVALSTGLGGSPKNPPVAGVVVVVDESPGGLGGPLKKPPVVVPVFDDPVNRLLDVAGGSVNADENQKDEIFVYTWFRCILILCRFLRTKQRSKSRGRSRGRVPAASSF